MPNKVEFFPTGDGQLTAKITSADGEVTELEGVYPDTAAAMIAASGHPLVSAWREGGEDVEYTQHGATKRATVDGRYQEAPTEDYKDSGDF